MYKNAKKYDPVEYIGCTIEITAYEDPDNADKYGAQAQIKCPARTYLESVPFIYSKHDYARNIILEKAKRIIDSLF